MTAHEKNRKATPLQTVVTPEVIPVSIPNFGFPTTFEIQSLPRPWIYVANRGSKLIEPLLCVQSFQQSFMVHQSSSAHVAMSLFLLRSRASTIRPYHIEIVIIRALFIGALLRGALLMAPLLIGPH